MFHDGQRLGEFEILGRLGQGGMGTVYKARQVALKRFVALKTLQASLASDPEYIARFHREAIAAASLNHPNLVQVHSAGESDGLHWFAMEFVEGESAQGRVKRKGRLDPAEAIAIAIHTATALEYGWRKAQLIHRDIKPDNIFLSNDGEVKLGDLGLAKSVGETQSITMTGSAMGTPHYVSPEQAEGKKDIDLRADIYSLGCTLYHLLTGQPPYQGDTAMAVMLKHVNAPVANLRTALPGCPEPLARAVTKMMAKQPASRQQGYADVLADLRRAYDALTGATVPAVVAVTQQPQQPPPAARPKRKAAANRASGKGGQTAEGSPNQPETGNGKSKMPRLAALVAVVAILGIAGWFAFGKMEPQLTEAERAEKARAEKSGTRSPAVSGVELQWKNAMVAKIPGWQVKDGVLTTTKQGIDNVGPEMRDGAIRVSFRATASSGNTQLGLRRRTDGLFYQLNCNRSEAKGSLNLYDETGADRGRSLKAWTLDRKFTPGTIVTVELHAVGKTISGYLDGQQIFSVEDDGVSAGLPALMMEAGTEITRLEIAEIAAPAKSAPPSTEPWQDVLRDPALLVLADAVERTPEGLRFTNLGSAMRGSRLGPRRDGAVRMRATFGGLPQALRARSTNGGVGYQLYASDEKAIVLVRWDVGAKQPVILGKFPLSAPFRPGQDYELELRVVGQTLTAKLNGQVLGTASDGAIAEGAYGVGIASRNGAPALVKALEVLDLDAPGKVSPSPSSQVSKSSQPPAVASAPPSAGGDVFTFAGHRYQLVQEQMTWEEAKARAEQMGGHLATVTSKEEDEAIRGAFGPSIPKGFQYFWLGASSAEKGASFKWVTGEPFDYQAWGKPPLPHNLPEEFPVALRLSRLMPVDGGLLGWNELTRSRQTGSDLAPILGFLVEWDSAEAVSNAIPATATKDAPFMNGLRMEFVPVPITGGPTDKLRVLFSVWETRTQDYSAFIRDTKREWPKVNFAQGPTHPMVMVSWGDATAFCMWLTERERKEGKLGANEVYRLPSDHEWSCAAGIGEREDAAKLPSEKVQKIADVFPWGSTWPPPPGVGNLNGEETVGHEVGKDQAPLKGYRDDFPTTAPVGSFMANRFGIYDLSGNVWEFCDDWYDALQTDRVTRGGSCLLSERGFLLSSHRHRSNPGYRSNNHGFRIVLAPVR